MKLLRILPLLLLFPCLLTACSKKTTTTVAEESYAGPYTQVAEVFASKDYDSVITLVDGIMDSEGESVEGLTYRGVAYVKLNKPYYAFSDLITAVSLDYSVYTLMNLGAALRKFGYCVRAADAYQQALALSPSDPRIAINLSSCYTCYGEYQQANDYFVMATQNFEKDAVSYTNAAILKSLEGDFEQSKSAAKKAIEYDALYRPAYKILAYACSSLGDRQCAKEANSMHASLLGKSFKNKRVLRKR